MAGELYGALDAKPASQVTLLSFAGLQVVASTRWKVNRWPTYDGLRCVEWSRTSAHCGQLSREADPQTCFITGVAATIRVVLRITHEVTLAQPLLVSGAQSPNCRRRSIAIMRGCVQK